MHKIYRMSANSIYKTPEAKRILLDLYEKKLASLHLPCERHYINTFAGKTHVLVAGKPDGPPVVVLHGINAGAPLTLEAIKGLADTFRLYALDTVGQATPSDETRLPLHDDSFARWVGEVMDHFKLAKARFIGVSYGSFLLQNVMKYAPARIERAVMVVPSGLVNGNFWPSMQKLSFPLIRFLLTQKEDHLEKFLDAFYDTKDTHARTMQRHTLLGMKMDYRRPPLLQAADVAGLNAPVYAMVADSDVFFPGRQALEKCRKIFKNFKGEHVLSNTKHMPEKHTYAEIEATIKRWLTE